MHKTQYPNSWWCGAELVDNIKCNDAINCFGPHCKWCRRQWHNSRDLQHHTLCLRDCICGQPCTSFIVCGYPCHCQHRGYFLLHNGRHTYEQCERLSQPSHYYFTQWRESTIRTDMQYQHSRPASDANGPHHCRTFHGIVHGILHPVQSRMHCNFHWHNMWSGI